MSIIRSFVILILSSLILLQVQCNPSGTTAQNSADQLKLDKYFLSGKQLYTEHCANCHQAEGTGLARLYPPINNADYLRQYPGRVICSIKYGMEGEIIVNGNPYNMKMPSNEDLTDLEVAQITTYIYNAWELKEGLVSIDEVREALDSCIQARR